MNEPPVRVLSVGNCGADHSSLQRLLQSSFGAEVHAASSAARAIEAVVKQPYRLVLVNRILDSTGEDGLVLVSQLKTEHPDLPVMLLSNYEQYQQQAEGAGAEPGFGKAALSSRTTRALLARYLS